MPDQNSNNKRCSDLPRFLTTLPVFNEAKHVTNVLDEVAKYATDVLVVDDGSKDGTRDLLRKRNDIDLILHEENRGYGAALQTAFEYAIVLRYDVLVTIDCDGQHEPQRIAQLVSSCIHADIVSGSRYFNKELAVGKAPEERRQINEQITAELNHRLGLNITDAFCGFKAYCTRALAEFNLQETGYAMPLELWVQAAHLGLKIVEKPVPLIYLDEERSFGDKLDAAESRMTYYREVLERTIQEIHDSAMPPSNHGMCGANALPCS